MGNLFWAYQQLIRDRLVAENTVYQRVSREADDGFEPARNEVKSVNNYEGIGKNLLNLSSGKQIVVKASLGED